MKRTYNPGWLAVQRERFGSPEYVPPPPLSVQGIGEVVNEVLSGLGLANEARVLELQQTWTDWVGKVNAARSRPGRWEGTVLTVYVTHHLWLAEMRKILPKALLKRLREHYGEEAVSEVRFEMSPD